MELTDARPVPRRSAIERERAQRSIVRQTVRVLVALVILATLLFYAVASLLPIYWMVVTSLKLSEAVLEIPPKLLPIPLSFDAYTRLAAFPSALRWFINSGIAVSAV